MRILFRVLLIVVALTIVNVHADPVYIDANLGDNTTSNSMAYSGDVGYLFNRYFGLEGGVTFSGSSNVTDSNFYLFDAAAKGILPLSSIVDLYGKLGVGMCNDCGNGSGANLGVLFGGGVQFNLNKNWSLHLEDYTVTGPSPNFIMFGGEFKFY